VRSPEWFREHFLDPPPRHHWIPRWVSPVDLGLPYRILPDINPIAVLDSWLGPDINYHDEAPWIFPHRSRNFQVRQHRYHERAVR